MIGNSVEGRSHGMFRRTEELSVWISDLRTKTWTCDLRITNTRQQWSVPVFQTTAIISFISFINGSTALFWAPGLLFIFIIYFTKSVGLLGRVISPSQGRYLNTWQHGHRTQAQTFMHWVGFEPTIPAFERVKTVLASARPLCSAMI
jgi:hypothetical protein